MLSRIPMLLNSVARSAHHAGVKGARCGICAALLGALCSVSSAWAQTANRLEKIEATPLTGEQVELRLTMSDTAPQPVVFDVDNPARISLDLPDTSISLPARRVDVKKGPLDTVTAAELGGRTRVVLNLDKRVAYDVRAQGNIVYVLVGASSGAGSHSAGAASTKTAAATASSRDTAGATSSGPRSIKSIDFRRGSDGSARIVV